MSQPHQYIVAAIVENRPGVLFRVTNLIRRRNFNIDSISVGALGKGKLARMTIVARGDERVFEQVIKQLRKLVEIVKLKRLELDESVLRELALVKIHAGDSKARSDIIHFSQIFRGRIIDVFSESMIVEVTGDPSKIDAFLNLVKGYGIKEVARTGLSALARGTDSMRTEE
ncbi:MAG: acetolactate synthase small subunit [Candidatus Bathyarchaeota archaeon]